MTVAADHGGESVPGIDDGGTTTASGHAGPAPVRATPLAMVGRADHLRVLRQAAACPPALVLVRGEAGIGKSRLIREWLDDPGATGTVRLVGHCTPLREPLPFGPVVDALAAAAAYLPEPEALSPVTGALRPLLPELSDKLPPCPQPLGTRRQERHRLLRGVRDVLAALGPAVLVLEDVQWLDRDTQELLRFLIGQLPDRLTLALTYRPEDLTAPGGPLPVAPPPPGVTYLPLVVPPLRRDEVADLVRQDRGRALGSPLVDQLYERTEGVPLAVEEMLRLLRERWPPVPSRAAPERPGSLPDDLPVPPVVRDLLLERVSRVSGSARRVLQAAAVLSAPAPERLLTTVAGLPPPQGTAGLVELVERSLLRPDGHGRYALRHGLARQAVLEAIAEPVRRHLHRRAVRALRRADPPPLAELARHSRAAGQVADWLRYTEAAADAAVGQGDAGTAAALLTDAVTWPGRDPETRARLAVKLGRAAVSGGSAATAVPVLDAALADDPPAPVRGELRMYLGLLLRDQTAAARQGRAALERAVAELSGRPGAQAQAMAGLGAPHLLDGSHVDDHVVWLSWAHLAATAADDPAAAELVHADRAAALVSIGDPAGWRLAGLAPGSAPHQPRLAVQLAWAATWVGHYRKAEPLLRAGHRLLAATGGYLRHRLSGAALRHDYAVGRWDGLTSLARATLAAATEMVPVAAEARLVHGLVSLATGDLRGAEAALSDAGASVPVAAAAAGGMARLAGAAGDPGGARRWIRYGVALVRDKGVWCWAAELVPVAVAVLGRDPGTRPEAEELLAEVAAGVAGRDSPLASAAVTLARAALAESGGHHREAAERYAEAARQYRMLPRPYDVAQATEGQGLSLLAAGEDGVASIDEAMVAYERLGASRDVARCRHLLRSLGWRLTHRRGRRGYGGDLSPRERDVVRLVRRGLTNREIAETLFLSSRTVEAHVARALRKLGLPSRRALLGRGTTQAAAQPDGADTVPAGAGPGALPPAAGPDGAGAAPDPPRDPAPAAGPDAAPAAEPDGKLGAVPDGERADRRVDAGVPAGHPRRYFNY